jgi:hypothetical protein
MLTTNLENLKIVRLSRSGTPGLGSDILSVLYNCMKLKKKDLAYFELNNFFYTNYENIWDYLFYQPFNDSIDKINKLKKEGKYIFKDLYDNKYIPLNYLKKERKKTYENKLLINYLRLNFNKFIKIKPQIQKKINNFLKIELKKKKVLAINIRGNDMFASHARGQRNLMDYQSYLKPMVQFKIKKQEFNKIYLATIDNNIRELFKKDFNKILVINKTILSKEKMHSNGDALYRSYYESNSFKKKLALESLIDMQYLARSNYAFYMSSNVSLVAMLMRKNFNYTFIDDHIDYSMSY